MIINKITFVPSKPFGNLLEIVPRNFITLETYTSEVCKLCYDLY